MQKMNKLLYGAAYYEEYLPYDRLAQDVAMIKKAGMNVVRIAESTWSTCEPQEGVFDFSHVERVLDAMEEAGISVIIGTPTYAVPTWMVKSHPEVLADTKTGRARYGARQIMDITSPVYLFYAERVIRELMKHTAHRKCVIGFQIDNETKYYGTAGTNVQEQFVKYLRAKFGNDLDAMNHEFGLDYWSNRINAWEDFPDVRGTINGSLGAEFEKFQRTLVDRFLAWQAGIVEEYRRGDQFVTHNFDFEWRGYSYGIQPSVNHLHAAGCLTIPGVDIYHPTQDDLTGKEIAFGGDVTRSLKNGNYLVLETEAQGFPGWTPYPGQLRLQAFSHLASGANGVEYWHWHSIHNSFETYWKGVLSHDFRENEVYREACTIGKDFSRLQEHLVNLKKENEAAILVSNESLTALNWFGIEASAAGSGKTSYNDVVRWIYDALYQMNIECDIIWPETEDLEKYKVIFVPALYSAPDSLLERLKDYTEHGGVLFATFKTGFSNENVKVSSDVQPHILGECFGVKYDQFTFPKQVELTGKIREEAAARGGSDDAAWTVNTFMELLTAEGACVLASYDHAAWGRYAALVQNQFGAGTAFYLGCMTDPGTLSVILEKVLACAGICVPEIRFPLIVKKGRNEAGHIVRYFLNYSAAGQETEYTFPDGTELLTGGEVHRGERICLPAWGFSIVEEF